MLNICNFTTWGTNALIILGKAILVYVLYLIVKKIIFLVIDKWANKNSDIQKTLSDKGIDTTLAHNRINTILGILKSLTGFVLAFVAIVMALSFFGLNIAPLLATAGVAGLAIGFGAQKIVKDLVTGMLILAENQYCVGERITTCGFTGEVVELGIRTTTIKGDNGEVYVISNGDISAVTNYSRGYSE